MRSVNTAPSIRRFRHPAAYAEDHIITGILEGTYAPGTDLPAERALSEAMGITRPTLREALQRLGREGWVHIRHGKPTRVADFWDTGGFGLLGTLARYGKHLPERFITDLLEFRAVFLPPAAAAAARNAPDELRRMLGEAPAPGHAPERWVDFDWRLQRSLCQLSKNPLFLLIINDFKDLYFQLAPAYFATTDARLASSSFYHRLEAALTWDPEDTASVVSAAMNESIRIWQRMEAGFVPANGR
ncbi:MAG: fatty acid metabolism transcriptional regulator FadR [Pseudomonadota bacterium]